MIAANLNRKLGKKVISKKYSCGRSKVAQSVQVPQNIKGAFNTPLGNVSDIFFNIMIKIFFSVKSP